MSNDIVARTQCEAVKQDILLGLEDRFIQFLDVGSACTLDTYRKNLKQFFNWMHTNEVCNPTRSDILNYKQYLVQKGYKSSTIQGYLTVVKLFFQWTATENLYPDVASHVKGVKIPTGFKKDVVSSHQVKDILHNIGSTTEAQKRDMAIVSLMAVCGLRCVEITRADVQDLRVLANHTVLYVQGKGHREKDDYVIVPEHVEELIRSYLSARGTVRSEAPLFASCSNHNHGGRLTTRSVSRMVKDNMLSNGITSERVTAHSLRHFAVTSAILSGESLQETQSFARHASINTTMIYNHAIEKANNKCSSAVADMLFG